MEASSGNRPWLIETPVEALGPSVEECVEVAGRPFRIRRPDAVERLRDHPVLGGASAADEYMPYWAHLWPGSRLLAEAVLVEPWPAGRPAVLEIGCGLGLPGIAALVRGWPVTFSDYDAAALRFAAGNARLNGCTDFQVLHLDWRSPPPGVRSDLVLAANPIYEMRLAVPLARFLRQTLAPAGLCLLVDQDLIHGGALTQALSAEGMPCQISPYQLPQADGHVVGATLYRIRPAG